MQRHARGIALRAWHASGVLAALVCAAGVSGAAAGASGQSRVKPPVVEPPPVKHTPMQHATGSFDVTMAPGTAPTAAQIARLSLDKRYHGALEASGTGEMLSAGNPAQGNAGYVAIERITGVLDGKTGSFAVMQMGTMASGDAPNLQAVIAPGSGTGELTGITGTLKIIIDGKQHRYEFDYQIL